MWSRLHADFKGFSAGRESGHLRHWWYLYRHHISCHPKSLLQRCDQLRLCGFPATIYEKLHPYILGRCSKASSASRFCQCPYAGQKFQITGILQKGTGTTDLPKSRRIPVYLHNRCNPGKDVRFSETGIQVKIRFERQRNQLGNRCFPSGARHFLNPYLLCFWWHCPVRHKLFQLSCSYRGRRCFSSGQQWEIREKNLWFQDTEAIRSTDRLHKRRHPLLPE